jgi:hypothetical protein
VNRAENALTLINGTPSLPGFGGDITASTRQDWVRDRYAHEHPGGIAGTHRPTSAGGTDSAINAKNPDRARRHRLRATRRLSALQKPGESGVDRHTIGPWPML